MAFQSTPTISLRRHIDLAEDDHTDRNLAILLEANAETARQKTKYRTDKERFEAASMSWPIDTEHALAFLGLMLGIFPPAAMFFGPAIIRGEFNLNELWIVGILLIVNMVSAVVGCVSGRWIGRKVTRAERMSWSRMIVFLPFLGALWGFMAGGAGGFIFFAIGSVFGAIVGGIVGAIALPVFTIFHRILQRGDDIELKHFLPLSLGLTLAICSVILGRI